MRVVANQQSSLTFENLSSKAVKLPGPASCLKEVWLVKLVRQASSDKKLFAVLRKARLALPCLSWFCHLFQRRGDLPPSKLWTKRKRLAVLETICAPAGCLLPPTILARRAPTPANVKAGIVTKGKPPTSTRTELYHEALYGCLDYNLQHDELNMVKNYQISTDCTLLGYN
jgi:hypothetical protein